MICLFSVKHITTLTLNERKVSVYDFHFTRLNGPHRTCLFMQAPLDFIHLKLGPLYSIMSRNNRKNIAYFYM